MNVHQFPIPAGAASRPTKQAERPRFGQSGDAAGPKGTPAGMPPEAKAAWLEWFNERQFADDIDGEWLPIDPLDPIEVFERELNAPSSRHTAVDTSPLEFVRRGIDAINDVIEAQNKRFCRWQGFWVSLCVFVGLGGFSAGMLVGKAVL